MVEYLELKPFTDVSPGQSKVPMMMFGLPAAAAALAVTGHPRQRKRPKVRHADDCRRAASIIQQAEILFMFIAPSLYLFHALSDGGSPSCCDVHIQHHHQGNGRQPH